MDYIFSDLNAQQKEAVQTTEGPVLIVAGPGSGKTKVLTHRVAYLIKQGVSPKNILAVTFTNKAAGEMKERIAKLLGELGKSPSPTVGTFHSIGAQLLRVNAPTLKLKNDFSIFDEKDQRALLKKIVKNLNLDANQIKPAAIADGISRAKNELIDAAEYGKRAEGFFEQIVAKAYEAYQAELKKNNALDFDDLLSVLAKGLSQNQALLEKYQKIFHYILVDEYQDVNHAQYTMIKLLAQKKRNLFAIGDSDQSIYTWRGADFRNILDFEKDWPDAKFIFLEQSYRSSKNILDAAQQVISKNLARFEKKLWTENPTGHPIVVFETGNEKEEGRLIAEEIKNLQDRDNISLKNMAVLYRTNAQSRALEESFLDAVLPYKIIGGVKFYERQEIKDILAYLRFIANLDDAISSERIINVPARGIGPVLEKKMHKREKLNKAQQTKADGFFKLISFFRTIAKEIPLSELILNVIKKIRFQEHLKGFADYEARWENVRELLTVAGRYNNTKPPSGLAHFLEEASLIQAHDEIETKKDLVNLMTLHCAKGLEFDIVFISGLEEGILPHSASSFSEKEAEEERRLCYVGITRAKNRVYLSYARRRTIFGQTQANLPSRFLYDLPEHLLEFKITGDDF